MCHFFYLMKMTGAPKGLVLGRIQLSLMYSLNCIQISANSSSLIQYSWGLGGCLYSSITLILCLVLLSTR